LFILFYFILFYFINAWLLLGQVKGKIFCLFYFILFHFISFYQCMALAWASKGENILFILFYFINAWLLLGQVKGKIFCLFYFISFHFISSMHGSCSIVLLSAADKERLFGHPCYTHSLNSS